MSIAMTLQRLFILSPEAWFVTLLLLFEVVCVHRVADAGGAHRRALSGSKDILPSFFLEFYEFGEAGLILDCCLTALLQLFFF
jgi:hypothetical protein